MDFWIMIIQNRQKETINTTLTNTQTSIVHHLPPSTITPSSAHTFESNSKSQPDTAEPPQVLVHPAQEDLKFFNFGGGGLTQPNTSKSLKDGKAMC